MGVKLQGKKSLQQLEPLAKCAVAAVTSRVLEDVSKQFLASERKRPHKWLTVDLLSSSVERELTPF